MCKPDQDQHTIQPWSFDFSSSENCDLQKTSFSIFMTHRQDSEASLSTGTANREAGDKISPRNLLRTSRCQRWPSGDLAPLCAESNRQVQSPGQQPSSSRFTKHAYSDCCDILMLTNLINYFDKNLYSFFLSFHLL